jgi:hypothetical protein
VRESRSRGSVRGALGNGRPYRDNARAATSGHEVYVAAEATHPIRPGNSIAKAPPVF